MTETTEGLTRRMSSGSESSARALAAKMKRMAGSASQGDSLRFNIFRAFFSKRLFEPETSRLIQGGVQTSKPNLRRRRRAASGGRGRRFRDYDLISREVNLIVTEMCSTGRRR